MSQLVLPGMRKQGWGRIINVSSVAGEVTMPGVGAYAMSKHAVECLTDALRYEVKSFGVDVISIQPGGVATTSAESSRSDLEQRAWSLYQIPRNVIRVLQRGADETTPGILKPEQVAQVIWMVSSVRRPRTRYKVGPLAKVVPCLRRLLPDRVWID